MDPASDECGKLFAPLIKLCFCSMLLKKKIFYSYALLVTRTQLINNQAE